jgi:hypothetical protein
MDALGHTPIELAASRDLTQVNSLQIFYCSVLYIIIHYYGQRDCECFGEWYGVYE